MANKTMLLTPNIYSRPQKKISKVKGVVIHWYANPKTKAVANRNFFENRKAGKTGYGSAHYLIDDNDVVQALPENEMGYHVGSNTYTASALRNLGSYPNNCTIGIEMAHDDWTGKPSAAVYKKTVALTAKILKAHNLTELNVWTHHQVVGWKDCHRWYTNQGIAWVQFIADVSTALRGTPTVINPPTSAKKENIVFVDILNQGDKGTKVTQLQKDLIKLGYKVGVDGIFGPATDKAVEQFQSKNKLAVDGAVGPATASALAKAITKLEAPVPDKSKNNASSLRKYTRTYKFTSPMMNDDKYKSTDIAAIQRALGIKPDGWFGHNTEVAVKNYQKKHGLKVDGKVGPATHAKMF